MLAAAGRRIEDVIRGRDQSAMCALIHTRAPGEHRRTYNGDLERVGARWEMERPRAKERRRDTEKERQREPKREANGEQKGSERDGDRERGLNQGRSHRATSLSL